MRGLRDRPATSTQPADDIDPVYAVWGEDVIPQGFDSIGWMQQLAGRLDHLKSRAEITSALDDVEFCSMPWIPNWEPASQLVEHCGASWSRPVVSQSRPGTPLCRAARVSF